MDFANELKKCGADSLSLAVVRDFKIVQTIAEGTDITPHTRFQAASISKMVFAFAVLRLAAEGKISLEDDVNSYLGGTPLTDRDGNTARVNVRQILSHTAGLGVHGFDGYPIGSVLPTTSQIIAGEPPCNSPKVYCEYSPDEHWVYSGGGFMVLQKCAENITGMDFADFMERYVLSPLEMSDSTFRQDVTENLAKGYTENSEPVKGGHMLMPEQAAAGLWT
ncbi:MAG: beta-lactamase family protein, partial [Oscillospiraceae bacterium]|nr:beta-lactamase family protein [Oscillospiraceae bacterium]